MTYQTADSEDQRRQRYFDNCWRRQRRFDDGIHSRAKRSRSSGTCVGLRPRPSMFFFFLIITLSPTMALREFLRPVVASVHPFHRFGPQEKLSLQHSLASLDAINQTLDHFQVEKSLLVLPDVQEERIEQRKEMLWEIMDAVSSMIYMRGGAVESLSESKAVKYSTGPANSAVSLVDGLLGRMARLLGGVVAVQSVGTLLSHNNHAFTDEVASRFLSSETATAVQTIRKIITRFPDHGVETELLSQYSPRQVTAAIWALSRLQQAAARHQATNAELATNESFVNPELVQDLAHYAAFATAAYGWKGALALSGKLHIGNREAVLQKTGIDHDHVVAAHWKARTHRPAFFIVRDVDRRKLVLCIRGTWSARDVLTDLCCTAADFLPHGSDASITAKEKAANRAHHGMLEAAKGVANMTLETVTTELEANPGYELVLIGHSLGGGVAAVLGTLWQDTFPGLKVYTYGCPCVGPLEAKPTEDRNIVSVVGEGDPFSCLSLGHIADLSVAISRLCEDKELRDDIFDRTQGRLLEMSEEDLLWCADKMDNLRQHMQGEKFYPSGRILHMILGSDESVTLREVSADFFRDLTLNSRMFDLTRHAPGRYEAALQRLRSDVPFNNFR